MNGLVKSTALPGDARYRAWLKRAGVGSFLFFFLKGMAWLVLIWWVAP